MFNYYWYCKKYCIKLQDKYYGWLLNVILYSWFIKHIYHLKGNDDDHDYIQSILQ